MVLRGEDGAWGSAQPGDTILSCFDPWGEEDAVLPDSEAGSQAQRDRGLGLRLCPGPVWGGMWGPLQKQLRELRLESCPKHRTLSV